MDILLNFNHFKKGINYYFIGFDKCFDTPTKLGHVLSTSSAN